VAARLAASTVSRATTMVPSITTGPGQRGRAVVDDAGGQAGVAQPSAIRPAGTTWSSVTSTCKAPMVRSAGTPGLQPP
jgi:hypothetical protein